MWQIPEAYSNFRIPDYETRNIPLLGTNILVLKRRAVQDKLDSIMDLSYYERDNVISEQHRVTWYNSSERVTKYYLDMGQTYALLYAIDVELNARGLLHLVWPVR